VIRRIVRDLDLAIEIVAVPTERESDGLARSSRNVYLGAEERKSAAALPRLLIEAGRAIEAGREIGPVLRHVRDGLVAAGFASVDYVELCDAETLASLTTADRPARLLAAARIGRARLIDNVPVNTPAI
jgi:pantoate--beta-alanine ligase